MAKRTIIVDGFGGDHSPLSVLQGCAQAAASLDVDLVVTGDEQTLRRCAEENGISLDGIRLAHAASVITNDDAPTDILKQFSDSSMAVGLKMLAAGEGDAFVSAGSTGALTVGATLIVKRVKGVKRAALGMVIPTIDSKTLLLDIGAIAECRPEMLVQFAHMGSFYMQTVMGVENPRVGLLNIGAEETKGTELQVETNRLLRESSLNFIGNVEGRDIPLSGADVCVADGFTGNVALKTIEGMGSFMSRTMKSMFYQSLLTKIAGLFVKKQIAQVRAKMDYAEYGGAPLLGISRPVIKAHGSSNGKAFYNAVRQAIRMVDNDMVGTITAYAKSVREQSGGQE